MIFTKSTFSKKWRKNVDIGIVFGAQNNEKSRKNRLENHVFFLLRFFCVFLRFFAILARFWEAPGLPKIRKKSKKNEKIAFRAFFGFSADFGSGFGAIFGDF